MHLFIHQCIHLLIHSFIYTYMSDRLSDLQLCCLRHLNPQIMCVFATTYSYFAGIVTGESPGERIPNIDVGVIIDNAIF